ncbi:MAG: hypothetical protein Q4G52_04305 [Clostridia bacterium]|nr:hypothetical protein [Clostridia bacterium]
MRTIYVLLSRSKTLLSRAVSLATGDAYTHCSIAFDARLTTLCSMARFDARFPLPAGLVGESPEAGYFGAHPDVCCALYALEVSDTAYGRARACVRAMLLRQRETRNRAYRYSVLGLLACRLGIAWTRPGRLFCSQLVGKVLEESGALALPKEPSLLRPQDFAAMPRLRLCFCGRMGELSRGGLTAPGKASMIKCSS